MARRRCIGLQVKNEKIFVTVYSLMSCSLERGHILVALVLLKNGANVNAKMNDGRTPMSLAKAKGHARMVELLVANGAK